MRARTIATFLFFGSIAGVLLLRDVGIASEQRVRHAPTTRSIVNAEAPQRTAVNWTSLVRPGERIPHIHHFVYTSNGSFTWHTADVATAFGVVEYVAIRSVRDVHKPDRMYFYYVVEPTGEWWERAKPMLILERIPPVTDIFGHRVRHPAHQSDFVRLQKLFERGGVYHDLDVVSLRPYPAQWYQQPYVMAAEYSFALCNAIMLAEANSTFGRAWIEKYRDFDDTSWNRFNTVVPKELSVQMPSAILVLPMVAFYRPAASRGAIDIMHGKTVQWNWHEHPQQYSCAPFNMCCVSLCLTLAPGAHIRFHMWSQAVKKYAPDHRNPNLTTVFAANTSAFCLLVARVPAVPSRVNDRPCYSLTPSCHLQASM